MAASARELHYHQNSVYGDLAFDWDRELREGALRHAGEMPRHRTAEEPKVRSIPRTHVQVRERQHVSVVAVVGFVAAIVMALLVLTSYVQLTELSSSVVGLKSQLTELETQNVTLTAQYQQLYDLSSVKQAAELAGMTKPNSSQVYYIDLSAGDCAVVYQQKHPGMVKTLLDSLHQSVYAVVEYFN